MATTISATVAVVTPSAASPSASPATSGTRNANAMTGPPTMDAAVPAADGDGAKGAAAGHPRLLVRASDLPRLRSWASSGNPVYASGLRTLALAARARMDAGTTPREDSGGYRYETYPT